VPQARAATAWAPPSSHTSSTPSRAAAPRIAGWPRPPGPGRGGQGDLADPGRLGGDDVHDHAGGVGAAAAGGVHPARRRGTNRWTSRTPGRSDQTRSAGRWAWWKARARSMASSRAARRSGPRRPRPRPARRRWPARRPGGVDPVEAAGRLGHGDVAAGGDVLDQLAAPRPGPPRRPSAGRAAAARPGRGRSLADRQRAARQALHENRNGRRGGIHPTAAPGPAAPGPTMRRPTD
jgi:hypothetical protein